MKKLIIAGLLAACMASGQAAINDVNSGNYWYNECKNDTRICTAYTFGVSRGVVAQSSYSGTNKPYCTTSTVTIGQMQDIFAKYLGAHPEIRHLDAELIFMVAIAEAFPCPK